MHKFTTLLLTSVIALFLSVSVFAAPKKGPVKMRIDTSKLQVKQFDANALTKYKNDKEFNYSGVELQNGQPSLWTRFWIWLWSTLFGWLAHVPHSGEIIKYTVLGLAIALLVYVVFKSLDIDPVRLLRGEAKKIGVPYNESLENIHEINFDTEIEKAITQSNYRLAVRLLYLKCLKQLSDTQLIRWQIDKTNSAYVYELADPAQKEIFGILTRQFEYVWYGNFSIDKQAFGNINLLFQNFKKQLP